jgi:hypothetical protein
VDSRWPGLVCFARPCKGIDTAFGRYLTHTTESRKPDQIWWTVCQNQS